jgi:Tfp pilus assembly protein PilO
MSGLQGRWARHKKMLVASTASIGGGLVYLLVFAGPLRMWFDLSRQLDEKGTELVRMERALRRREQVETLCKKFEQRILATGTDAEELGVLLKELESLTRTRKIEVKSIKPLPSQWVGSYRKFLVWLKVEGRVHNMVELLYAIDTSPKILTVESLQMQALRKGSNLLSADILISRTSAGAELRRG